MVLVSNKLVNEPKANNTLPYYQRSFLGSVVGNFIS